MAYQTGAYTDQDNAGDLVYAWALTNGWTQNYSASDGTGKRYHISKSIDGTTHYFNLRTALAESPADLGGNIARGLCVQGSTAWDGAGTDWDKQTGYTPSVYGGLSSACGNVDDLKALGGTYHFFATATSLSAVFDTDSDEGDWRMFTIGSIGGFSGYFASGGNRAQKSTGIYDARSSYCARARTEISLTQNNHCSLFVPTEGWYGMMSDSGTSANTRIMHHIVDSDAAGFLINNIYGSTTAPIVFYTPDSFRGNAQLAPSLVTIKRGIASEVWPIGDIGGVKFINMTNYENAQEIPYSGDTYKLFRIFNLGPTGVAFLK